MAVKAVAYAVLEKKQNIIGHTSRPTLIVWSCFTTFYLAD